jgi:hypothetical protein
LLPRSGANRVRHTANAEHELHLLPVTVLGSVAVVGEVASASWVEDVEGLSATVQDKTLVAQWKWPMGVDTTAVVLREDQFAAGPKDPRAKHVPCVRRHYELHGGFRHPLEGRQRVFVTVYAAAKSGDKWHYASGSSAGARREVHVSKHRKVRYRLERPGKLKALLGKPERWNLVITPDAPTDLPAMLLLAKPEGLPLHPQDGQVVVRIEAGRRCDPGQPLILPLEFSGKLGKQSLRLFPADEADCEWMELIPA